MIREQYSIQTKFFCEKLFQFANENTTEAKVEVHIEEKSYDKGWRIAFPEKKVSEAIIAV